jgi:outer membrane immunogenic protein
MKMKLVAISIAALATAMMAATPAAARVIGDTGAYVGAGYTQYDAEDVDVGGGTLRAGYRFHPNFGVEGEASFGIEGDTADNLGTPVDVDLNQQYGVYGIGFLPISENFELFARAGYATIDAQSSVGGFTAGTEDDGVGLGAGVNWGITENFAVRAEYTRLEADEEDNDGVNAFGLSGIWGF